MMNGFYSGYMTSVAGHGIVLFVFKDGIVTGVDVSGVKFDGTYALEQERHQYTGKMSVVVPPNISLVQGVNSGPLGMTYEVDLDFPENFLSVPFIEIKTPLGKVNVRLEKLRDLGRLDASGF